MWLIKPPWSIPLRQNFNYKNTVLPKTMDRIYKWQPKGYSFIFVPIRPTSLISRDKIQKKFYFGTMVVGLIIK